MTIYDLGIEHRVELGMGIYTLLGEFWYLDRDNERG